MLSRVHPQSPDTSAYLVPFTVDRRRAPLFELRNDGSEAAIGIALTMLGDGRLLWGLPTALEPGASMRFVVHGDDLARDSVLIVRWFRPGGDEYLWRVVF